MEQTRDLILATRNAGKAEEFRALLRAFPLRILTLDESGFDEVIEERGRTLEENALLKAKSVFERTHISALADDSGLEVAVLRGEPGVRSARYAGEHCSEADNRRKLLAVLRHVDSHERTAQFRCVLALVDSTGERLFNGMCRGSIALEERGAAGFGYDKIFIPDGFTRTFAEMTPHEKNGISHRGKAAAALLHYVACAHRG